MFIWAILALVVGAGLLILSRLRHSVIGCSLGSQHHFAISWSLLDFILILIVFQFLAQGVVSAFEKIGLSIAAMPTEQQVVAISCQVAEKCSTQAALYLQPITGPVWLGAELLPQQLLTQLDEQLRLQPVRMRWLLLGNVLSAGLMIALTLLYMRVRTENHLYQMGWHAHRWLAQLHLAYLAWFAVTPMVFLVLLMATSWHSIIGKPTPHVADQLMQVSPSWASWVIIFIAAIVAAPVWEEVLMRGLLQPILTHEPIWADSMVILGMLTAVAIAFQEGSSMGPMLFLLTVGPGYVLFDRFSRPWLPHPGAARGIFATSLFFASMHFSAWPSPIPLFFLSLALGYVSYRAQSLLAPIAFHALFNLVSLVQSLPLR